VRRGVLLLGVTALLLVPGRAHAHLVSTGFGPFYDGVSHLFLSPDDLLGVVALALLAGLGGPRHGRLVLVALPAAWLAGGLIGLRASAEVAVPVASTATFLIVGLLVAADRRLPAAVVTLLAAGVGLVHGSLNGSAMAQAALGTLGLVGVAASVFTLVALLAALVASLRWAWARIAVRVAGSWIAATGLLMLGWAFRATG
jgi:urease accessory protein